MRFAFTDDQRALADGLRDMLARECTPAHVRAVWDADTGTDRELWSRLAEMGVIGLLAAEADGGMGASMVEAVLVFQELGRAAVPGPVIETAAVVVPALAGSDVVAELVNGRRVATAALDGLAVVPHAAAADVVLCPDGLLDLAGATTSDLHGIDHGRRLASVTGGTLTPVAFDIDAARERAALATAAFLVGAGETLITMAGDYARDRRQFGRPIGSFQAVKHLLADALLRVEFAKAPLHRAAWSLTVDDPDQARDVSMAKVLADEAAHAASRAALQVHGAIGYTWESDLHLWMKKVWALERTAGTTSFHRHRVRDAILGGRAG